MSPFDVHLRSGLAWAASQSADHFTRRPIAHFEAIRDAAWYGRWADAAVLVAAVGVLSDRGEDTLTLDNRLKNELAFDWEAIHKDKAAADSELAAMTRDPADRAVDTGGGSTPAVEGPPAAREGPQERESVPEPASDGWD